MFERVILPFYLTSHPIKRTSMLSVSESVFRDELHFYDLLEHYRVMLNDERVRWIRSVSDRECSCSTSAECHRSDLVCRVCTGTGRVDSTSMSSAFIGFSHRRCSSECQSVGDVVRGSEMASKCDVHSSRLSRVVVFSSDIDLLSIDGQLVFHSRSVSSPFAPSAVVFTRPVRSFGHSRFECSSMFVVSLSFCSCSQHGSLSLSLARLDDFHRRRRCLSVSSHSLSFDLLRLSSSLQRRLRRHERTFRSFLRVDRLFDASLVSSAVNRLSEVSRSDRFRHE